MSSKTLNQAVLREERETRGLTISQMSEVLGLEGAHAHQIVIDFESGFRKPKGSALRVYELLNRQRWASEHLLGVDPWTISEDGRTIHHNGWPRFVGVAMEDAQHPHQWQFKKAGMPAFDLIGAGSYQQIVFSMVDHVPEGLDVEDLFTEAVRLIEAMHG
jgi:transcriptional regulator with XRE-family HTH domain